MAITNALAGNFIDTNSKDREFQASGTSTFLESELENVRERLLEMEAEIKRIPPAIHGGVAGTTGQ